LWKLARKFGYKKSPPSFLDLETLEYSFKLNIMLGVNFASGGSGILRYTGYKQSVTSLILVLLYYYKYARKFVFAIISNDI
jgi:hypothetical protein